MTLPRLPHTSSTVYVLMILSINGTRQTPFRRWNWSVANRTLEHGLHVAVRTPGISKETGTRND
jgi:hypothetical protein